MSAADGPGGTTAGASLRRAVAADLYLWGRRRLLVALGAVGVAALLGLWAWALRAQTASGALAVSGRPGTGAVEGDFRAPLVLAAALVTTIVLVLRYAPRWHGGRADLMRLAGPGAAAGYLAQSLVCAIAAATAGAAVTVGLHLEVMAIAPSAAAAGLGAAAAAAAVSCALLAAGRVGGLLAGRLHGSAQALAVAWPFSALPAVNSADGTTPASGAAWAVLAAWAAAAWLIGLRRATVP